MFPESPVGAQPEAAVHTLEDSLRKTWAEHSDRNCSNSFVDLPPRVMQIKTNINKWDLIKLKSRVKEIIQTMRRQPAEMEVNLCKNKQLTRDCTKSHAAL